MARPFRDALRLSLIVMSFLPLSGFAQMPGSAEFIEKGIKAHDQGKYSEALALYRQVHDGDTNYALALYEMTLSYMADSAFAEAKQAALEGLELPDSDKRGLLLSLGHVYDYLGMRDSALWCYDSVARMNPTDHQPWYEKGVLYAQQESVDAAFRAFQKALMINPYHFRSHLALGQLYLSQGRLTEAWIPIQSALLTTGNGAQASEAIRSLDAIAKQLDYVVKAYRNKDEKYSHPRFDDIDQIINARLALEKEYKVPSVLSKENIVRVAHVIMERLRYEKNDTSFVMQYYVPLLEEIRKKSLFDPYMLQHFSGYNIESVEEQARKQKSGMETVRKIVYPYLNRIAATRVLNYEKRKEARNKYYVEANNNVYVSGNISEKGEPGEGYTRLYKNHYLLAEGAYNKNGKKEGKWKYYYNYGQLRLEEEYRNGVLVGKAREWYRNGILRSEWEYNQKEEKAWSRRYRYDGTLYSETVKQDDDISQQTFYHKNGKKEGVLRMKGEEVVDGKYKYWHENGVVAKEMVMQEGHLEGHFREYYEDGTLRMEAQYRKGKLHGPVNAYYRNGKPERVMNYQDDKRWGNYEQYDDSGRIVLRCTYRDGKEEGEEYWYEKGVEHGKIVYKKGVPVSYRFTDASGKVSGASDGPVNVLVTYYLNGNKNTEAPYRNQSVEGEVRYYYPTGQLKEKASFAQGERSGKSVSYDKLGAISVEAHYEKGELHGSYKSFFPNGKVQAEGTFIEGTREGLWKYYYSNGKLKQESFFVDGDMNGSSKYYNPDGTPDYTDIYDLGLLNGVIQYDTNGKAWRKEYYPPGKAVYRLLYDYSTVTLLEVEMKNGLLDGFSRRYFPDGKLEEQGYFRLGRRDSLLVAYHYSGGERVNGMYRDGARHGFWVFKDEDGIPERETYYNRGDLEGKDKTYVAGTLRYEYSYHDDLREGNQYIYGDSGALAIVLVFDEGVLTGYTYPGKDGALLPVTPVKNGTGTLKAYYPDGKPSAIFHYQHNMLNGKQMIYYKNGKLAEERNLERGDLHGPYKRFYPDGKPHYEVNYVDDEMQGTERRYDRSGKVVASRNYTIGSQHGPTVVKGSETGKTIQIDYYYGVPTHIRK